MPIRTWYVHASLCCATALALTWLVSSPAEAKPPAAGPLEEFATGIAGPEGLAFTSDGGLIVGTTTGDVLRFEPGGGSSVVANVGEALAGITVLRDGRILAASLGPGRVWSIDEAGNTAEFATGIGGPNFIVETRRGGRVFATAALIGEIVDVTSGTPVTVASGLSFPNGLAIGKHRGQRYLYVAESIAQQVQRYPLDDNDQLGPVEFIAAGLPIADGLAIDRGGNVIVVGGGQMNVIVRKTGLVEPLSTDPLLNWPSNVAFGRGRGFRRREAYLANFGPALGDGINIVRFRHSHSGTRTSR